MNSFIEKFKELVEDFYEYTITISITEFELFSNYEWLKCKINRKETTRDDYYNEVLKDILFDFIFNKNAIASQFLNDYYSYDENSLELVEIKEMYKRVKEFIDIYIEELE